MKIACFGASVTQQKTGYWYYLQKLFKTNINIYGFGGEHLVYGGVVHINKVLYHNPSLCFIDWFTTGYKNTDEETILALDTIKYKFTINNCKIIFLFFPRKDHNEITTFYNFIKKYLHSNNISFIDLNNYLKYSDKIIRDVVHTTNYGAEKYAKIIFTHYNSKNIKTPINIQKTIYSDVKELQINKIFKKELELTGNCNVLSCGVIIGPKSGYLQINNSKCLLWDRWCYYTRNATKLNFFVKNKCKITILDEKIDYSSCKNDFKFENNNFELNLISIYYIGDSLDMVNGC